MDRKLESRIARLEKLVTNERRSAKFERVNFDELDMFFDPYLNQTLGFDRVYDIAKAATEYVTDKQKEVEWGDPVWVEKLKLASALNPKNNPIFEDFCKLMKINFNELDRDSAKFLSSGVRRTLGKWATAHLKANGAKMSREERKYYFSKPKQTSNTNGAINFNIADRVQSIDKQVDIACDACMKLRDDLMNASQESSEYSGIIVELNKAFRSLNDADQILQNVAERA